MSENENAPVPPVRIATMRMAARTISDLVARCRYQNQTFILTRSGRPVAKLSPLSAEEVAKYRASKAKKAPKRRR